MTASPVGRVFLSYRRDETSHVAGRLARELELEFGEDHVFMDVDSIAVGVDFAAEIERAVARCQVLLALIGPHWTSVRDERGRRRLDNSDDYVALEIRSALGKGVRVIPVLVDGAEMPGPAELPGPLKPLATRNAARLDHETFASDVRWLLEQLTERPPAREPGPARPRGRGGARGRRGRLAVMAAAAGAGVLAVAGVALVRELVGEEPAAAGSPGGPFDIEVDREITADGPAAGAGRLETAGGSDVYTFAGRSQQVLYLQNRPPCAPEDLALTWTLTGPDGQEIRTTTTTGCGQDPGEVTLPSDGDYRLTVRSYDGKATGTYGFQLWNVQPQSFTIAVGDAVTSDRPERGAGRLESPGTRDVYTFSSTGQQVLYIQSQPPCVPEDLTLSWALTGPAGQEIRTASTTGCDPDFGEVTVPTDGDYRLSVRSLDGDDTGTYGFQVWPVRGQFFTIQVGDQVVPDPSGEGAGRLETPGTRDVYTFTTDGRPLALQMQQPCAPEGLTLTWTLGAADGTGLQTFATTGCPPEPVRLAPIGAGEYRLTARSYYGDGTGIYSFRLVPG